jgi:hypothetical protein
MAHRALFASALIVAGMLAGTAAPAAAREAVDASAPEHVSVTMYRSPTRNVREEMQLNFPTGLAMISEERVVTLPARESTIRFDGVAEGMIAVSAIVTGLPGGTIEKNRNADLLSAAALVDGTLGNRVTITRTNPASGEAIAEDAIVRTRADGGIVLQTSQGYEAVRCSGLPEGLAFDRVPDGLSAKPVFSIDTRSDAGGTYTITLTYLAWGFDWQANYIATLAEPETKGDKQKLRLMSWLTLLNDNSQSFEGADLQAVAGQLNVVSDYESLADPPRGRPLRLTCYPIGSTAAGSPVVYPSGGWSGGNEIYEMSDRAIVVTGSRVQRQAFESASPIVTVDADMIAKEENLGDLKLYRVPMPVTVASKSIKQVAFLDQGEVEGRIAYKTPAPCMPWNVGDQFVPMKIVLRTKNDEDHGLGMALPSGAVSVFGPASNGDLLVGEDFIRDHAEGQDVEIGLAQSAQVFSRCERKSLSDGNDPWHELELTITNANPQKVTIRAELGSSAQWNFREPPKGVKLENGQWLLEREVDGNSETTFKWDVHRGDIEVES